MLSKINVAIQMKIAIEHLRLNQWQLMSKN